MFRSFRRMSRSSPGTSGTPTRARAPRRCRARFHSPTFFSTPARPPWRSRAGPSCCGTSSPAGACRTYARLPSLSLKYRITTQSPPNHHRITTESPPNHHRSTTESPPNHHRITDHRNPPPPRQVRRERPIRKVHSPRRRRPRRFRHGQHRPVLQEVSLRGPVAPRRAHGRAHARTRALQVRPLFCTFEGTLVLLVSAE